jgi:Tfp pilus assembly PilM family ATPase
MMNVFFDIRGKSLRVLIMEGEAVTFIKGYELFHYDDPEQAGSLLDQVSVDSGKKIDKIHLILPSSDVSVQTFRMQTMAVSDAEKIIRRKIIQETDIQSPAFKLTPLSPSGKQQGYIAEIVKPEAIQTYYNLFRTHNIAIKSFSTSFQGNLKTLRRIKGEMGETNTLLDIENDMIEMTVLSRSGVIYYERMALPNIDMEKEIGTGLTEERVLKMKLYRIVDSIYNMYQNYKSTHPENPVKKAWICGPGASLEGIHEALRNALGTEALTLSTFGESVRNGSVFTALHGVAFGISDNSSVNYIPREILRKPLALNRTAFFAALGLCVLAIVSISAVIEARYRHARNELAVSMREYNLAEQIRESSSPVLQKKEYLRGLQEEEVGFYEILKYLAESLPEDVFIESIAFRKTENSTSMEMRCVTHFYSEIGKNRLLSRVIDTVDTFGRFRRVGEPSIAIVNMAEEKLMNFTVVCEVRAHEK